MSKGNMLLGYARGKVGDVVFSRFNGKQITRARNRNPKNPKSQAQCIQRMVQATISGAASAFKAIVDHSWEGVPYGLKSLSKFRKENMTWLRTVALSDLREQTSTSNFCIKGAGVAVPARYILSKGSLTFPQYTAVNIEATACAAIAEYVETDGFARIAGSAPGSTSFASYEDFLGKLGLAPGDQLTMVRLNESLGVIIAEASEAEAINSPAVVDYARIVFKKTPDSNTPANWYDFDNATGKITFTDEVVDTARSSALGSLYIQTKNLADPETIAAGWCMGYAIAGEVNGVALIRSQEATAGAWLRSNSVMAVQGEISASAEFTWPSYAAASSDNMGSDYYLNNALGEKKK